MSLFRRKAQPKDEWPFDEPPNVAVVTTSQVITEGQPVLYVSHDEEDGGWQFHMDGQVAEAGAKVVSLRSIVSRDGTIKELADQPLGWIAARDSATAQWQRAEVERPAT